MIVIDKTKEFRYRTTIQKSWNIQNLSLMGGWALHHWRVDEEKKNNPEMLGMILVEEHTEETDEFQIFTSTYTYPDNTMLDLVDGEWK